MHEPAIVAIRSGRVEKEVTSSIATAIGQSPFRRGSRQDWRFGLFFEYL
jgi:hypothetical protein